MALSTVEVMAQQRRQYESFKNSGQEEAIKNRLNRRVQLVLDGIGGRRTPRNLYGLRPIRRQELFAWYDDQRGPAIPRVAGKSFDFGVEEGESLVEWLVQEHGGLVLPTEESGRETSTVKLVDRYPCPSGVEFRRTAYLENRILHIGDTPEFIPGFSPTYAIYWDVSRRGR